MSTGARSTDQWREHRALLEAIQRGAPPVEAQAPPAAVPAPAGPEPAGMPGADRTVAIVLGVIGLLWLAAIVTSLQAEAAPVAILAARISLASGPLALLGILYLLFQRTSRRESRRFAQTAAAMRAEATALEASIAQLGTRIDDNRRQVADHTQELLRLGEDSTLRLAEIGATMKRETHALTRQSELLENASANVFADMGILLSDLPTIETRIQSLAETLRETGRNAGGEAERLNHELTELVVRAREVDEGAGAAAQRLSAHLARIDSISDAAGNRIDAAADGIARTVDAALASAADAVDATRSSIDTQGQALLAMVEQSSAAFARTGDSSADAFEQRIAAAIAQIGILAGRIDSHDTAARDLLDTLSERIATFDRALAVADVDGNARAARLGEALRALGDEAGTVADAIGRSNDAAESLIARGERLPAVLASVEAEAARGGETIAALLPQADAIATGMTKAGRSIARIDAMLAGQKAALDALAGSADEHIATLEERARAVETVVGETGEKVRNLTASAAPQLVEALLRVRETAALAAEHAARAFHDVIGNAAARLGEESRLALDAQIGRSVEDRLAAIATASERAVAAAEAASRRLTDEMTAIAATTSAVEKRIGEGRAADEASGEDGVSSRVAHLIEQLNSIGIDVTRLLDNDVSDTLWAAYLKGDRGIFTRRATRLVDATEAKEIARRYEDEPAFRDQVNRYIHDFEAMLRHILATRDGSLLGVTLLSADMGKLYVALAQAIERLRT